MCSACWFQVETIKKCSASDRVIERDQMSDREKYESETITTPRAIHDLSNVAADRKLPVAFEAKVTYSSGWLSV
jgi:hypothetical protein